jgi:hypothetical protein
MGVRGSIPSLAAPACDLAIKGDRMVRVDPNDTVTLRQFSRLIRVGPDHLEHRQSLV